MFFLVYTAPAVSGHIWIISFFYGGKKVNVQPLNQPQANIIYLLNLKDYMSRSGLILKQKNATV